MLLEYLCSQKLYCDANVNIHAHAVHDVPEIYDYDDHDDHDYYDDHDQGKHVLSSNVMHSSLAFSKQDPQQVVWRKRALISSITIY